MQVCPLWFHVQYSSFFIPQMPPIQIEVHFDLILEQGVSSFLSSPCTHLVGKPEFSSASWILPNLDYQKEHDANDHKKKYMSWFFIHTNFGVNCVLKQRTIFFFSGGWGLLPSSPLDGKCPFKNLFYWGAFPNAKFIMTNVESQRWMPNPNRDLSLSDVYHKVRLAPTCKCRVQKLFQLG